MIALTEGEKVSKKTLAKALRIAAGVIEKKMCKGTLYKFGDNKPRNLYEVTKKGDIKYCKMFCAHGAINYGLVKLNVIEPRGMNSYNLPHKIENLIVPSRINFDTITINSGNLIGLNDAEESTAKLVAKHLRVAARKLEHGAKV